MTTNSIVNFSAQINLKSSKNTSSTKL